MCIPICPECGHAAPKKCPVCREWYCREHVGTHGCDEERDLPYVLRIDYGEGNVREERFATAKRRDGFVEFLQGMDEEMRAHFNRPPLTEEGVQRCLMAGDWADQKEWFRGPF